MRYTKEIFDILRTGGFISENSLNPEIGRYYAAIEDDYQSYKEYYEGIGLILEEGNGYFYFSRVEKREDLTTKVQRLAQWIDRVDFLKTFNNTFSTGLSFRTADILVRLPNDLDLKDKAKGLYPDADSLKEKVEKLVTDMLRIGFIEEEENTIDETYRVTTAFRYIEDLIDCLTIIETEEE